MRLLKTQDCQGPTGNGCSKESSWEPQAALGHRSSGTMASHGSLARHQTAQEQGWDWDSDLGQLRDLQSLGKISAMVWTKVWPGSSPQVMVRMKTGEMCGQGPTQLQQCPEWSHRQVTLSVRVCPKPWNGDIRRYFTIALPEVLIAVLKIEPPGHKFLID